MIAAIKGHKAVLHYLTDVQQHVHTDHLCQLQSTLETTMLLSSSEENTTIVDKQVQSGLHGTRTADAQAGQAIADADLDHTDVVKADAQLLRSTDSEDILSETRLAGSSEFDADIHATSYEWEVVTCPHNLNTVLTNPSTQSPYISQKKTFVRTPSPAIPHPIQQPSNNRHHHVQHPQQQKQVPVMMKVHQQQQVNQDETNLEQEALHQRELEALKTGYMERVFTLERQVRALQMILLDERNESSAEAYSSEADSRLRRVSSVDSDDALSAATPESLYTEQMRWVRHQYVNVTQQIERVCGDMTQKMVKEYKLRGMCTGLVFRFYEFSW